MSSLVKSPKMTPAKVAANQANSLQSAGPATPEGLDRVRQGRLQHGLRASDPRDVLAFLGEDADEFDRYEQALFQKWQPSDTFEETLVRRIARNSWRVDRAARVQENTIAHEVETLERDRAFKAEDLARNAEGILSSLYKLLEMNRKGGFTDAEAAMSAYGGVFGPHPSERGCDVFDLMCQLSPALQIHNELEKPGEANEPSPKERARINVGRERCPPRLRAPLAADRNHASRAASENGSGAAARSGNHEARRIAGAPVGTGRAPAPLSQGQGCEGGRGAWQHVALPGRTSPKTSRTCAGQWKRRVYLAT